MIHPDRETFHLLAAPGRIITLHQRVLGDQLTPVLAYRRLVARDERTAPSFLLESVEGGERQGRYSILGAQPSIEIVARAQDVEIIDHARGTHVRERSDNPLTIPARLTGRFAPAHDPRSPLPDSFIGGWVGFAGYDAVRYLEPEKLPFSTAPRDDRHLPDLHFALYNRVVVFDHVDKIVHVIASVAIDETAARNLDATYEGGCEAIADLVHRLDTATTPLRAGSIDLNLSAPPQPLPDGSGNFTKSNFERAVSRTKEYIAAGDAFQVVLSQRFERTTNADPFDIYRALRVVNPSPYMIYLQARGCIMVASSPEILCRVRRGVVTSRPLAGTRKRGGTPEEDHNLEKDLLADPKERAEHIMLVDLARNDLGTCCDVGSISIDRIMEVERYSHVMHISSTVTGRLREGLTSWDALRATLPVGTVSGAPKVRAMQIIDELEPTRRGPYGGGIGAVGFDDNMDIALTLRTMVIETGRHEGTEARRHEGFAAGPVPARQDDRGVDPARSDARPDERSEEGPGSSLPLREGDRGWVGPDRASAPHPPLKPLPSREGKGPWTIHLQAGAGIVADSVPAREYEETVNKAAALGRAIDLAEQALDPLQPLTGKVGAE
jgi:anthranilate synthase component 1